MSIRLKLIISNGLTFFWIILLGISGFLFTGSVAKKAEGLYASQEIFTKLKDLEGQSQTILINVLSHISVDDLWQMGRLEQENKKLNSNLANILKNLQSLENNYTEDRATFKDPFYQANDADIMGRPSAIELEQEDDHPNEEKTFSLTSNSFSDVWNGFLEIEKRTFKLSRNNQKAEANILIQVEGLPIHQIAHAILDEKVKHYSNQTIKLKREAEETEKSSIIILASLTLFIGLFAIVGGTLIRYTINKEIQEITLAVKGMVTEKSGIRRRITIRREDEMGILMKYVNQSLDRFEYMIEELKGLNSKLIEAKEKAEAANIAKSEFLNNITHELRTPLTGIMGFAEQGVETIDEADKASFLKYFSKIFDSGERLLTLVNHLLDLAKMESGKMIFNMENQNLMSVIVLVKEELEVVIQKQSLSFEVTPPQFETIAYFDSAKIAQVIRNLVNNAIKFTPKGKRIVVSFNQEEITKGRRDSDKKKISGIKLSVWNEGENIPEDELESIFDKFVQSSTTKTLSGGTGLGLPICKQIMIGHNGIIWAENTQRGGPQFNILLMKEQKDFPIIT